MKTLKLTSALLAAGVATMIAASPAAAQKSAVEAGLYWNVQDVRTEPGHTEQYLDYLKSKYKSECDWNISKGYMVDCKVLGNVNRRANEPDLVLIRIFKEIPSVAESQRRSDEFNARSKMDDHSADADGGSRAPIRKLGDNTLWQELNFTK